MQKLINLVNEFGEGDHGKNKAKRASVSTKGPTGADYQSSNHVSHTICNINSNSAKNVSNYLTSDAKKAIEQLFQAFTKALIFQHFDLKKYIRVETDVFEHAISGVLSQLINDVGQWHPVAYFLHEMIHAKT